MDFVKELKRTHYCGDLRAEHAGQEVVLMGWVNTRRDHGGLVFVDLRDREGLVQVVLNPSEEATATSKDFRNEFVVALKGTVKKRPDGMQNKKMATGEVEIEATSCAILSEAQTPPFQIDDTNVSESLRLEYRYLDLRTDKLQANMKRRHQITKIARDVLNREGFLEIETPILYKSTPEGARDYLVPSRVHQGEFYALPQSPQTLKQLLMVSGYDRYYQVARCFRDEDLRADRQPEFSQIDIEMSFVNQDDVLAVNEKLAKILWKEVLDLDIGEIPRMTYDEAMERFGVDRPDLRFGMELKDLAPVVKGSGFKVFDDTLARGGRVKGIPVPGGASFSRAQLDKLTDMSKKLGAKGLVWIKWGDDKMASPVSKFFDEEKLKEMVTLVGGGPGDAALIVGDEAKITGSVLAHLRNHLGRELGLIDESQFKFTWVVDFPLLEYDAESKRWVSCHHPFTSPRPECEERLLKEGTKVDGSGLKALAYDLVCNGHEIAGGSIRIHRQNVQQAMFDLLGISPEECEQKFGFFINGLKYGTPPHGGIAWGLDRLCMLLCGTEAIRDVIAFPKTTKAYCLMSRAPSAVDRDQLIELGIRLRGKED